MPFPPVQHLFLRFRPLGAKYSIMWFETGPGSPPCTMWSSSPPRLATFARPDPASTLQWRKLAVPGEDNAG
jgi:hypothetical protein